MKQQHMISINTLMKTFIYLIVTVTVTISFSGILKVKVNLRWQQQRDPVHSRYFYVLEIAIVTFSRISTAYLLEEKGLINQG